MPWSKALDPLITYSSSNHPLALEVHKEYELQTIKIVKVKYGWSADSNGDLFTLASRIVKLDLPDLIDDIKVLVKTDTSICTAVNVYCSYELVRKGNFEKAFQLVNSLDEKQCEECCLYMLNILSVSFFRIYNVNRKNKICFIEKKKLYRICSVNKKNGSKIV